MFNQVVDLKAFHFFPQRLQTKISENFHVCSPRSFLARPTSLLWLFAGVALPPLLLVASVSQWPSASHHTSKKTFAKTQWRGVKENTMEKSQRKHSGERSNKTQWREVKENTVEKSQRIATNLPGLLLLVISSGLQPRSQSCKMSRNIIIGENLHFLLLAPQRTQLWFNQYSKRSNDNAI